MTGSPDNPGTEAREQRWADIAAVYRESEAAAVERLLPQARLPRESAERAQVDAHRLIEAIRARPVGGGLDALLHEYDLESTEGIALMCLAEALIRVPDDDTADALIQDKLASADWAAHAGNAESLLANAATWGLMLGGRLLREADEPDALRRALHRILERSGEPVIRAAVRRAMRLVGDHFVYATGIDGAVSKAKRDRRYRYSFDMLGESARTAADAGVYYRRYLDAIHRLAESETGRSWRESAGISVKLSALHPRFGYRQTEDVLPAVADRLLALARAAREADIGLTIDAEEAEVLQLTLAVLERVLSEPSLAGWDGLGLAVQAYQKRAVPVIDWLAALARDVGRTIPVRLVKGAYWDNEIKRAQQLGLDGYPVFTRKVNTDVSYLACARRMLAHGDVLYPQFATHNAHTLSAVLALAPSDQPFEFQRLHGMGEGLYEQILAERDVACRVYAPVGDHRTLLPYLIRRLLENGANTSFVNRVADPEQPPEALARDPVETAASLDGAAHPGIPLPRDIYGRERANPVSVDLSDTVQRGPFQRAVEDAAGARWRAAPMVAGEPVGGGTAEPAVNPADARDRVGEVRAADRAAIDRAVTSAADYQPSWNATPAAQRAACLERAADSFESHLPRLAMLAVREGGKSLPHAIAEVREAIDFCRYYALQARELFEPRVLAGPTGERNLYERAGRGVFACISPWNFPVAIFTGQIAAALVAGNTVIAKPAEQTPLIAAEAVRLLHAAGIPAEALQFLPGDGEAVGAPLIADPRLAGVMFTGSVATARAINRTLAERDGPIATLIAETGGVNAMIVDSTALPEQVVDDVLRSAFDSAGQRCSALRVLCLQDEVADEMIEMLAGAMAELRVGDPIQLRTDAGPVIDAEARNRLSAYIERMRRDANVIAESPLANACEHGHFVAPIAFEIDDLGQLEGEVFGPVLHVLRYRADAIDELIEAINAIGFGLTFGVHSRIDHRARALHERVQAGNTYINRDMIAAVPGVQPFGGMGLSGTGPKAGGEDYLRRLSVERSYCVNTAAMGGNASLLALDDGG